MTTIGQTGTASLRQLCLEIEEELTRVLSEGQNRRDYPKNSEFRALLERTFEEIKKRLGQLISACLPRLINLEETLRDKIEDLQ